MDIGNSSRALTDEEKAQGIEENVVALDGIAMITEKSNTVKNLTKQQLARYLILGKIKNWKEVGGLIKRLLLLDVKRFRNKRSI